jgi:hypothetical protein
VNYDEKRCADATLFAAMSFADGTVLAGLKCWHCRLDSLDLLKIMEEFPLCGSRQRPGGLRHASARTGSGVAGTSFQIPCALHAQEQFIAESD